MRFRLLIDIIARRMESASFLPIALVLIIVLILLGVVVWRYGAGVFIALLSMLIGLQLIAGSDAAVGMIIMARYPVVLFLVLYLIFSRRNEVRWSPALFCLLLLHLVMFLNSGRSDDPLGSFGLSFVYFLFFVGIILGGQKILGDSHGRAGFIKILVLFSIFMTCLQIPFLPSTRGRLMGAFVNPVGFMTVGEAGTILLFWYAMRYKTLSIPFIFYIIFTVISLTLLILTAGRTALAATALGMLVVLARKLKRNLVVFLAVSIIFGPVVLRAVVSFPGFEAVRGKLFSMRSSGRSALFADAWQKAKQKPIFGWGTQMSSLKSAVAMGGEYHNAWLQYAVDHGIPFGIFIMCVYLWLPFRGLLLMGKCQTEEMKNMANLSSAFLAACVFSNYLGGGLYVTTGILPAYSYIALQEGVRAEQRKITSYGVEYPEDHSLETWIDEKYLDEEILYR